MRTIKFRFFDYKLTNSMIYQDPIEAKNVIFEKWETTPKCSPLMQYTGLNDKNCIEIYEGDIVQTEEDFVLEAENVKGVIKFYECSFWIENEKEKRAYPLFSEITEHKIIGNIYENPELLEGDNQ